MQPKCSACGMKKSRFVKEQEAKGLLSNSEIKTPLIKIPLLNVFFFVLYAILLSIKLKESVNKFLLVGGR